VSDKSLKSRTASGATWSVIDGIVQQILSLAIFIVLGRLLLPELFGIVSTALTFVFLMRSTVLNAVSSSLVTLMQPEDRDYDTAFWLLVAVSLFTLVILNLSAKPIAGVYGLPELEIVIRMTSLIVLALGLSYAHFGWARRNFRFRALAIRNIAGTAVGGLAGIAVALAGYGLAALVVNQLLAALVSLVLLWCSVPWRPSFTFSEDRARVILSTAVPQGLTQSLQFVVQNFDVALVTYLLGPSSGGLYAAAKRINLAVQLVTWQPISTVMLPAFAEVVDDPGRLRDVTLKTASTVMTISAPVFVGIAAAAPGLIALLFGDQWLNAAPILTILSVFSIAVPNAGVLRVVLLAQRDARRVLYFTAIQAALSLAGLILLRPNDVQEVAYCLAVPAAVSYLIMAAYVCRHLDLTIVSYLIAIGRPLLAAALMAASIKLLPDLNVNSVLQTMLILSVGGAVYLAAMLAIARDTLRDILSFADALIPARIRVLGSRARRPRDPR
jgi:O-antigen/teichoic acid export membrane protein